MTIARNVDGTHPGTIVYPPRFGFPTGAHFRVNLQTREGAILAQSNEFDITV
ncbi:hypothetical protein P691DRAFT_807667 [Macrolepiota fuliginosa MF-IS2]|uniref:Uncharacterized protein n=1 Tax=Macrolepiota fuliginosa MF-IS2 TaxID=1400762 RepID=A0A9P5X4C6_9AGAR|nr:hypothetical protein P691DRAFT_807667 [Macrolepiota fuliginosa MF-IS2]